VVFFECRIDQLTSEQARTNELVERLKADLAEAARREVELKAQLAAAETRIAEAVRERDDARRQVEAFHAERERFLGRLIQAEQVRQAGGDGDGVDLAEFIAELRAEVLSLRAAVSGGLPPPPTRTSGFESAEQAAESFAAEGRLGVGEPELEALCASARFETRSEETLFTLSLRELSASDPASRARAAQRLKALGPRAALPAVAAALNAERDKDVRCALLEVMGAAGDQSVLPLVQPHLGAESIEVRLAALETAVRLGQTEALERALKDSSPLVRRRAAVLASGQHRMPAVLERACRDADASVRRVAVLGLGTGPGTAAEAALLGALDDADASVRRAAAKGLSRTFGAEVYAIADLDPARRRREIRRLASLPKEQRVAIARAARSTFAAARATAAHPPEAAPPAPAPQPHPTTEASLPAPTAPEPTAKAPELAALEEEVLGRIYASLRGQSQDDLARAIGKEPELVLAAALALERQGRLVRRGQRYFVP
jgi:hypothetical protein